jgi:hypothetical protein
MIEEKFQEISTEAGEFGGVFEKRLEVRLKSGRLGLLELQPREFEKEGGGGILWRGAPGSHEEETNCSRTVSGFGQRLSDIGQGGELFLFEAGSAQVDKRWDIAAFHERRGKAPGDLGVGRAVYLQRC